MIGHRDTGKTACPGDALYDQLDEIRALVESGAPFATFSARVTAALADQRVDYGEVVPVNGTLAGPDGSPLAGQVVEVQVNSDNAWRTSRRVTTGADGVFATDLKPAKRMYVRVRYPGSADVRGSASPRLLLNLRPVLTFERPPRRGVRGRRVVVAGTVAPRKRVVTVVFQQRIRRPLAQGGHARGAHAARPLRDVVRAGVQGGVPVLRGGAVRPGHGPGGFGAAFAAGALSERRH